MAVTSLFRDTDSIIGASIADLQGNGSALTDFTFGSTIRTVLEAQAVVVSQQSLALDQLSQDVHLATATGAALDAKGGDYLVPRKGGIAASGQITLTRPASGVAVTIPAGWTQLLTAPAPGQTPLAFATTQDAVFGSSDVTKTVSAVAVLAGAAGNIADQTPLFPVDPVSGFPTDTGFKAQGAFANGVDPETDDAYRTRIRTTVQGRVNGSSNAFVAAATGVNGVTYANVLGAGATRANGTIVPAGSVEVYYEGASGVSSAVLSACQNASTENQSVSVFTATLLRIICNLTVIAPTGADPVALTAAVVAAAQAAVGAVGVGADNGKLRVSTVIQAVNALTNVRAVSLPFADFRKSTDAGGTYGDITVPADSYASLAATDITVAFIYE